MNDRYAEQLREEAEVRGPCARACGGLAVVLWGPDLERLCGRCAIVEWRAAKEPRC